MNKTLITIVLLVFSVIAQGQSLAPCTVGKNAPPFGFWTWRPRTRVQVYILKSDFNENDIPFLLKPFANWNSVSELTGSQVKFDYIDATSTPLYCENCLTVMRGPVFDGRKRHATELRTYSARGDQIMTWAQIVVDPRLTNPKALTNAVAHELGHNFGLLDCYTCKFKTTVMNQFKVVNEPNDMEGPTTCDIAQVKAAFLELAVRVRPAPKIEEGVVDEGEEPEDDDTPIVIRKP